MFGSEDWSWWWLCEEGMKEMCWTQTFHEAVLCTRCKKSANKWGAAGKNGRKKKQKKQDCLLSVWIIKLRQAGWSFSETKEHLRGLHCRYERVLRRKTNSNNHSVQQVMIRKAFTYQKTCRVLLCLCSSESPFWTSLFFKLRQDVKSLLPFSPGFLCGFILTAFTTNVRNAVTQLADIQRQTGNSERSSVWYLYTTHHLTHITGRCFITAVYRQERPGVITST